MADRRGDSLDFIGGVLAIRDGLGISDAWPFIPVSWPSAFPSAMPKVTIPSPILCSPTCDVADISDIIAIDISDIIATIGISDIIAIDISDIIAIDISDIIARYQ